jgi:protein TonB
VVESKYASDATPPALLFKVEPEYSDEARQAKLQGEVVLRIDVSPHGTAQNITVVQSLGLGLDERAAAAVARWKFRPGYSSGKPVVTAALIHVTFRLL